MVIYVCDICGNTVAASDLRYIRIMKVSDGKLTEGIEVPVMAEREACVHCAEEVKAHIDSIHDAVAERDVKRGK